MGVLQAHLALSTRLIMWIGHRREIRNLAFRALALRRSELRNSELLHLSVYQLHTYCRVSFSPFARQPFTKQLYLLVSWSGILFCVANAWSRVCFAGELNEFKIQSTQDTTKRLMQWPTVCQKSKSVHLIFVIQQEIPYELTFKHV